MIILSDEAKEKIVQAMLEKYGNNWPEDDWNEMVIDGIIVDVNCWSTGFLGDINITVYPVHNGNTDTTECLYSWGN